MSAWWEHDQPLRRLVSHLLQAELRALRPGADEPAWPVGPWADSLRLDENGLGIDSLDRLHLAVALARTLDLEPSREDAARLAHAEIGVWLDVCRQGLAVAAARSQAPGPTLSFRTSGSTGVPRRHRHGLAALEEEAEFLAALLPGRRRILSAVPAHHIYGFIFTVLLPRIVGGIPVLDLGTPLEMVAEWAPGDLIIGFPDGWRALAELGRYAPSDLLGVTSTAACPGDVAIALSGLGVGLIEVFGSSETAGLGWRRDPDAPFRWFPWWQCDDGEHLTRRLSDGSVIAVSAPDYLLPAGGGCFLPGGRRDRCVQVGGINVSPEQVRAQMLQHPWVGDAVVRLMRPEEGNRLKAFIVPTADAPPEPELRRALLSWIETELPAAERPRALRFGSALPSGDLGKAADWNV